MTSSDAKDVAPAGRVCVHPDHMSSTVVAPLGTKLGEGGGVKGVSGVEGVSARDVAVWRG